MSDLGDLLIQYLTMSGNANAAPPSSPVEANPTMLGSQGVLGQALLKQRQQTDELGPVPQEMPPPAPSSSSGSPAAAPPVQSQIRPWAFTHLPPDQWTHEEADYFNKLHGITGPPTLTHLITRYLAAAAAAGTGASTAASTGAQE